MSTNIKEVIDLDRCRKCGGRCCLIYLEINRPETVYFEDWVNDWDLDFKESGANRFKPFFNPLYVHMNDNEHVRKTLRSKGINPNACQYLGKNGCIIPRENRPKRCREYMCQGEK